MSDIKVTPAQTADVITTGTTNNGKKGIKVAILLASLGMVLFIVITLTFSFKEPIFSALFPKPATLATAPIPSSNPPTPAPSPSLASSPQTTQSIKRLFLSSALFDGNLGGLNGADQKCQQIANSVKLEGTWKAWLSDSKTTASSRLSHSTRAYLLLDGKMVAENWADLTDGVLKTPLNLNEASQSASWSVWTNSVSSGSIASENSCGDWTSNSSSDLGRVGSSSFTDQRWSSYGTSSCNFTRKLYCIEQ